MSATSPVAASEAPPTRSVGAQVYSVLAALSVLLIVVQVLVAGSGLFTIAHQLDDNHAYTVSQWNDSPYWGSHFFNAIAIAIVILAMLGTTFAAKLNSAKRLTGILLGLLVLQAILGFIPWPAPVSALHVLNAFAMLGIAGALARQNWAFGRRPR